MTETNLTTAALGFGGAIVGSAISLVGNWLLAKRRDNIEAKREEISYNIENKKVARLVLDELIGLHASMEKMRRERIRWVADNPRKFKAWEKYREHLAALLSDNNWWHINLAFQVPKIMESNGFDGLLANADSMSENQALIFEIMLASVKTAMDTLTHYVRKADIR